MQFSGRLVARRALGTRGFGYLESDGNRQQIFVHRRNVGDAAYKAYRGCELGTPVQVSGEMYRTKHLDIPTIRVKEFSTHDF